MICNCKFCSTRQTSGSFVNTFSAMLQAQALFWPLFESETPSGEVYSLFRGWQPQHPIFLILSWHLFEISTWTFGMPHSLSLSLSLRGCDIATEHHFSASFQTPFLKGLTRQERYNPFPPSSSTTLPTHPLRGWWCNHSIHFMFNSPGGINIVPLFNLFPKARLRVQLHLVWVCSTPYTFYLPPPPPSLKAKSLAQNFIFLSWKVLEDVASSFAGEFQENGELSCSFFLGGFSWCAWMHETHWSHPFFSFLMPKRLSGPISLPLSSDVIIT